MKGNIHNGDKIYRIVSKELVDTSKSSYKTENKKIGLVSYIVLRKNEPIVFKVEVAKSCENNLFAGIKVKFSSEIFPTEAKSKPISKERVIEQLSKTGDTIFFFF